MTPNDYQHLAARTLIEKIEQTNTASILEAILDEYIKATSKHPHWPNDTIHAAAILAEESGELIRASIQFQYEGQGLSCCIEEAIQTGAMSIRFLINIENYSNP